ncbi:hypothetical protein A3Q56_00465 [Intoshia linei]|uniref:Uncharacterized protein n=1 Tax=Intoshia linei TaxID=1819745 RepID=A0A177BE12_9BILA|nr:hypothetical protein A3Q56_00465 [Intoshia linei]
MLSWTDSSKYFHWSARVKRSCNAELFFNYIYLTGSQMQAHDNCGKYEKLRDGRKLVMSKAAIFAGTSKNLLVFIYFKKILISARVSNNVKPAILVSALVMNHIM